MFTILGSGHAQNLDTFEESVTEFELDNGLQFIVLERHDAPVVSFHTFADVGAVNEVKGITGMAHVFEHMAFKGTETVGTNNLEKERLAMEKVDKIFHELRKVRNARGNPDSARIAELREEFEAAKKEAQQYVVNNEMGQAIDRAGGTGLNATTSADWTRYYYSLPSNKMELWFSLESDRFLNPVLREFYVEKEVVMEERRMRAESQPVGRLLEEFLSAAFKAHPYGEPTVGHMSDLETMTRAEARDFFQTYYGANNLTIAVVGDVDPSKVRTLAETYFGRLSERPDPPAVETEEPEQLGERRVILREQSQPLLVMGYHKGSIHSDHAPTFTVISDILGRGRTSRLHQSLVQDQQIATNVQAGTGYPGRKYPNLFYMFAVPSKGHTADTVEKVISSELERLKADPISFEELEKAKTRARADLIRQLRSNSGLANQLTYYEATTGDWRNLFNRLDAIEEVTADDVRRVARNTFVRNNRTVAEVRTVDGADRDTVASQ
jgi:predicted Zn-dependent peptidase